MDRYEPLRRRTIALVGLMGVGKSSVGRRLASALSLPFRDADAEVEAAAGRSIADIFAALGEPAFRDGERRVITRLLEGPPHVLATGGGAYMNAETRALIKERASRAIAEEHRRARHGDCRLIDQQSVLLAFCCEDFFRANAVGVELACLQSREAH